MSSIQIHQKIKPIDELCLGNISHVNSYLVRGKGSSGLNQQIIQGSEFLRPPKFPSVMIQQVVVETPVVEHVKEIQFRIAENV